MYTYTVSYEPVAPPKAPADVQVKGFAPDTSDTSERFGINPDTLYSQTQAARLVGTDRAHMWHLANSPSSPVQTYAGTNGVRVFLGRDLIAYCEDPTLLHEHLRKARSSQKPQASPRRRRVTVDLTSLVSDNIDLVVRFGGKTVTL